MPVVAYRPVWEFGSILAWLFAGIGVAAWTLLIPVPGEVRWISIACVLAALRDVPSAWRLHVKRGRLRGHRMRTITFRQLQDLVRNRLHDAAYAGDGFCWGAREAQCAFDLKRGQVPPTTGGPERKGLPWIHGIGDGDRPVWFPHAAACGHTLVVGTTGAGKTRLLALLVTQAVLRQDAVIVFDPKGDMALADTLRHACAASGAAGRFHFWHRAFPEQAFPLDPLAHARDLGELASRIAGLARREDGLDVFTGFAQRTIRILLGGMRLLGERHTLRAVLKHLERGPDSLLQQVLQARLEQGLGPDWARDLPLPPGRGPAATGAPGLGVRDLLAAWRLAQRRCPELAAPEIDALAALAEHDRAHAQKLLAGMLPILHQLTSGPLGTMLDPESPVQPGQRAATDFDTLIQQRAVVYLGLDSLSDPLVGAALGRLLLADLASLAGSLHHREGTPTPVACYIDEAAECLAEPAIALLNKGRSAGFSMTVLTQTLADFVAATGSEARARQVLGNTNNVFCLRVRDALTRDYVASLFPDTVLRTVVEGIGTGSASATPIRFAIQAQEQCQEQVLPLVDPMLLGTLPDLEGFAQFAGGGVRKIAIPLLAFPSGAGHGH